MKLPEKQIIGIPLTLRFKFKIFKWMVYVPAHFRPESSNNLKGSILRLLRYNLGFNLGLSSCCPARGSKIGTFLEQKIQKTDIKNSDCGF